MKKTYERPCADALLLTASSMLMASGPGGGGGSGGGGSLVPVKRQGAPFPTHK